MPKPRMVRARSKNSSRLRASRSVWVATARTCERLKPARRSPKRASASQPRTGAGASFPAPIYSKWAEAYNKATGNKINYQSVGSGAGIKQIKAKTVDFGASDMPLKDEELKPPA
jgi:ABC-type phosphate transport system substrate-binding protein